MTRDPFAGMVAIPQSLNRYQYVVNNPALYVDPYGYAPWDRVTSCLGDPGDCAGDIVEGVVDYVTDPHQIGTGLQIAGMWVGSKACPAGATLVTGAICAGSIVAYVAGTILKWEDIHQEAHRGECSPAEGKARQIVGLLPLPGNPVTKWLARQVLKPVVESFYSGYAEACEYPAGPASTGRPKE